MEIYQLKTFVTVAKHGSITKAAALLYLSQPAVSAHIKGLEEQLGLRLFERNAKGMQLTPSALALLGQAEQMLQLQRQLLADARQLKAELPATLRLGSNRSPSAQLLGQLLSQLSDSAPELEIVLRYGSTLEIAEQIADGSLDAGFYTEFAPLPLPATSQLQSIVLQQFGIFLAAPAAWQQSGIELPLTTAMLSSAQWQQLATLPWICPAPTSCCGYTAEQVFEQQQFRPRKLIQVDQEHVTRTLIASGVGIGLLHAGTAQQACASGEVVLLGPALQQVQLHFGYRPERQQEPLLQLLIQSLPQLTSGQQLVDAAINQSD